MNTYSTPSNDVKFTGSLVKGNVRYYFEIREWAEFYEDENCYMPEEDAYIEKTFIVGGRKADEHAGHFTIAQARKCYKALLAKGFKASK